MGKINHKRSASAKGLDSNRSAPYPKKARVEVTYEGEAGESKSKTGVKNQPVSSSNSTLKRETEKGSVGSKFEKGKGKSKAIDEYDGVTKSKAEISNNGRQVGSLPNDIEQQTSGITSSFIIIAGSYEKLLYGLEGHYPSPENSTNTNPSINTQLNPIFMFPAHLACVKAIAASPGGKWLATGSEDEFVKVWDLRRRKEVGSLSQHTATNEPGSITSLHFPSSSHLLSTSVDGTISLFRTSDWALLKSLKGHSGRVNWVDVHPTGRVALSVGKDKTLKMWDLMRGRGAASLPLDTEAEMVKFSPLGTHFAVLSPKKVEIYSLTLKLLHTLETKSRFNAIVFTQVVRDNEELELICVGTEKGVVEIYTVKLGGADEVVEDDSDAEAEDGEGRSEKQSSAEIVRVGTLTGHSNRIKSISALQYTNGPTVTTLLSTVSSDGFIKLFDLTTLLKSSTLSESNQIESVASYDTKGSRLTCVFLADGRKEKSKGSTKVTTNRNGDAKDGQDKKAISFGNDGQRDVVIEDEEEDEDDDNNEEMYDSDAGEDEDDDVEVEFEDDEEEEEEVED